MTLSNCTKTQFEEITEANATGEAKNHLIVKKAQEMGLTYQINENHQWTIDLNSDYILFQTESGWRLSVEKSFEIYLGSSDALEFLEDLYNN